MLTTILLIYIPNKPEMLYSVYVYTEYTNHTSGVAEDIKYSLWLPELYFIYIFRAPQAKLPNIILKCTQIIYKFSLKISRFTCNYTLEYN